MTRHLLPTDTACLCEKAFHVTRNATFIIVFCAGDFRTLLLGACYMARPCLRGDGLLFVDLAFIVVSPLGPLKAFPDHVG
jgi:hypothetical protein